MDLLKQLGVDNTLWIQLGFFMICYYFISHFIFAPYKKNLEFRKKNTTGASAEADKLTAATEHLAMDYEGKLKNQNQQILETFNRLKNEGKSEEQKLISAARTRAEQIIQQANDQIGKEIQTVRSQIEKTIPQMSRLAASRLLSRDL